jgi:acyl carrier protein|tara:strand:+ start:613 stop:837 length:225 start_codon:yes stop_codon:yes gene_type:complete
MKKNDLVKELAKMFDEKSSKFSSKLRFTDLRNWDSLKQMELIIFTEKVLKKKLKLNDILCLKSFSDLIKLLKIK